MSDYEEIKRLAEAATPQDFDSAQKVREDFEIDCPSCDGDGYVEVSNDYCNYDDVPLGVQFYGIGQEHIAAEAYYRAMNPAKAIELISQLTTANARVEKLEAVLAQAADDITFWGDYADEYFQKKHGLGEDIEKYAAAARGE